MIIKVCGICESNQLNQLEAMPEVQFIGHIFFRGSKRFVSGNSLGLSRKKVGVFVNATREEIQEAASIHSLTNIQLHGQESPAFCREMKQDFTLFKAFGLHDAFDFSGLESYESSVDYFVFDTATQHHGGSGKKFNWNILADYTGNIPFLLSGGISPSDVAALRSVSHPQFAGIDINSGFEESPGVKNIEQIQSFIHELTFSTT